MQIEKILCICSAIFFGVGWSALSAQVADPTKVVVNPRPPSHRAELELIVVGDAALDFAREFDRWPSLPYRRFFRELLGHNPKGKPFMSPRRLDSSGDPVNFRGNRFSIKVVNGSLHLSSPGYAYRVALLFPGRQRTSK